MIKAIVRKEDNQIKYFNNAGHGTFGWTGDKFKAVKIPDQDIDQFYEGEPPNGRLKEIYYPDDVKTYKDKGKKPPKPLKQKVKDLEDRVSQLESRL